MENPNSPLEQFRSSGFNSLGAILIGLASKMDSKTIHDSKLVAEYAPAVWVVTKVLIPPPATAKSGLR